MKKFILSVLLIVSLLSISACSYFADNSSKDTETTTDSPDTDSPKDENRFYKEADGYSIVVPADWEIQDDGYMSTSMIAMSPVDTTDPTDTFTENMNVIREELPYEISLQEYADLSFENAGKMLNNFTILEQGDVTINGVAAKWLIYTHQLNDFTGKVLAYMVIGDSSAYVLTFSADTTDFDTIKPTFTQIAESFKLEN